MDITKAYKQIANDDFDDWDLEYAYMEEHSMHKQPISKKNTRAVIDKPVHKKKSKVNRANRELRYYE